uniref:Uncharacterized protein n=1 Tax=Panagrolaimus sp. PS1159 TaxID=55785 RepID=A0AC35FSM8_9BILA
MRSVHSKKSHYIEYACHNGSYHCHISDGSTVSSLLPIDIEQLFQGLQLNEEVKGEISGIVPISARDALVREYRKTLIEKHKKKFEEFIRVPQNLADIHNGIYSRELILLLREINKVRFLCRELILLLREINKNFHLVPCPLSEIELKRIGIDRSTMPPSLPVKYYYKSTFQVHGRGRSRGSGYNNGTRNSPLNYVRAPNDVKINNRQPLQSSSSLDVKAEIEVCFYFSNSSSLNVKAEIEVCFYFSK